MRFFTERNDRHALMCQAYRIRLGFGGPERIFELIRDDTEPKTRATDGPPVPAPPTCQC
ncbi:hypothetical protein [Streptomyces sp. NBC_01320]|uniref:hypothetical protein n=1 Tax=Streptomyces sp. NBC_01320 TaxID=2903824 RepID=UPI002E0E2991|nr:hypothetical protein OG395_49965 [Streptomyces sp. NBC_01320]